MPLQQSIQVLIKRQVTALNLALMRGAFPIAHLTLEPGKTRKVQPGALLEQYLGN